MGQGAGRRSLVPMPRLDLGPKIVVGAGRGVWSGLLRVGA